MRCIALFKIDLTLTAEMDTRTYYAFFSQLNKKLYRQFFKHSQSVNAKKYSLYLNVLHMYSLCLFSHFKVTLVTYFSVK